MKKLALLLLILAVVAPNAVRAEGDSRAKSLERDAEVAGARQAAAADDEAVAALNKQADELNEKLAKLKRNTADRLAEALRKAEERKRQADFALGDALNDKSDADKESPGRSQAMRALHAKRVQAAQAAIDAASREVEAAKGDVAKAQADYKGVGSQVADLNSQLAGPNGVYNKRNQAKVDRDKADHPGKVAAALKAASERMDVLEGEIGVANFGTKLSDLKSSITDMRTRLEAAERIGNQGIFGEFVRKKLERLLNNDTDAFCKAAANCGADKKDKKPVSLEELFTTTNDGAPHVKRKDSANETHK